MTRSQRIRDSRPELASTVRRERRMIEFRPIEPVVFTPEEACKYLRLEVGREMPSALRALARLVDEKKQIRPIMYLRGRMYRRDELDRFLEKIQR